MKHSLSTLDKMYAELASLPYLFRPSLFWKRLSKIHTNLIKREQLVNFKRTLNGKYFNWNIWGILSHQLYPVYRGLISGNLSPLFNSSLKGRGNWFFGFIYSRYLAYLYDYVSQFDRLKIFKKVSEPLVGDPILVNYKKYKISQDLCNSVFEFYGIYDNILKNEKIRIAEIGAGYGRLAYIFLKTLPDCSYCIIDIPPALYVSQEYLREVFPKEKFFLFRPFSSYHKIKNDFEKARIKFLMPHQIELLPTNIFDLIINISSFHEMRRDQINYYFRQIDRLSSGYLYSKQWQKSRTKDNNFIKFEEYPVSNKWKTVYSHKHPIQGMFFESLYKIGNI